MSWKMYKWVWQVKAPIHIGWAPSGALNRTRLYIPARTIWGAFTAEIGRRRANNSFPNYGSVGAELRKNVRFTYLFPAKKIEGKWITWLPSFKFSPDDSGSNELPMWNNGEESEKSFSNRKFKKILLTSLQSTAINPETFSAEESTLREIEVIKQFWNSLDYSQVGFVGCVFIRDEGLNNEIFGIKELFLGADTRYGFGRIGCEDDTFSEEKCFGKQVRLHGLNPVIKTDTIFGHLKAGLQTDIKGSMELVQQWDTGKILISGLAWVPGSYFSGEKEFEILPDGFWVLNSKER